MKKGLKWLMMIGIIIISFLYLNIKSSSKDLIGAYVDGEYSSTIPGKDNGYYVEKIVCDNGAVGKWDYNSWGILTTNMSKKSRCNVYFKKDKIVNNIKASLDITDKCPTVNSDGTVNVSSAESENSLVCSAPDNYGTSYYFRSNVSNNYVKFAGFYWRIVRINGDGSIRLIYDGTSAHQNGEASDDRIIGTSAFNEKYDDNAYVGYMYGTPGSSTYEETHANINSSTIKKYVDNWYESNLKDTKYEEYLADNIFCNDRRISNYNPDLNYFSNLGYAKQYTFYARGMGPWSAPSDTDNAKMSFKCIQGNDTFTQSSTIGNQKLIYSIALLTKDELVLGGLYSSTTELKSNYLYVGNNWWLISPDAFDELGAKMRMAKSTGEGYSTVNSIVGVKPVINLKPGSLIDGDGTINNPYIVE